MAWGSLDARMRLLDEVKENIKAYFNGELRNRVDKK
jgi:glycerate dehydrogenase